MKDSDSNTSASDHASSGGDKDLHQALALSTGDLLNAAQNLYFAAFSETLDDIQLPDNRQQLMQLLLEKPSRGFANENSFKRILTTPLAQDIMLIIWKESGSVPEYLSNRVGFVRIFDSKSNFLTQNSLKNLICENRQNTDARMGDAMKQSVDRICDALEVIGLIDKKKIRENLKPISGTAELDRLMTGVYCKVADVFAQQLQLGEDDE